MRDLAEENVVCPYECNKRIRKYYNWENVSARTELVYNKVSQESVKTAKGQLQSYLSSGAWPYLLVVSLVYLILALYDYVVPRKDIDISKDYNSCRTKKLKE